MKNWCYKCIVWYCNYVGGLPKRWWHTRHNPFTECTILFFKISSNIAVPPAPMSSKWFVSEGVLIKVLKEFLTSKLLNYSLTEVRKFFLIVHSIKPNKSTNGKIAFLQAIHQNSNMFQSILIIFRDLLNINEACRRI
jgi:hypothetical protein